MLKVLVISDIHGDIKILDKILKDNIDSNIKIFLGDFQVNKITQEKLSKLFDYVVKGNNDYPEISSNSLLINLDGIKTYLDHGANFMSLIHYVDRKKFSIKAKELGATLAMHGHNHKAEISTINGVTVFNPGSPSFPRFGSKASYGIINIDNGKIISIKNIYI